MKKLLFICIFLILIISSLFYPAQIIEASKNGILVWFEQILPALLPFTILSTLLLKSNFLKSFSKGGNLLAIGITMCYGFIFGFPIGAKLASDFYKNGLLTEQQAIILSVTANNFSPMYVCGFVLPTLFSANHITQENYIRLTYILLYFLPLCIATILILVMLQHNMKQTKTSFFQTNHSSLEPIASNMENHNTTHSKQNNLHTQTRSADTLNYKTTPPAFKLNMLLLDASIMTGFETLIKLCGYIVLFSIFAKITMLFFTEASLPFTMLIANLEITNGIQLLSNSHLSAKTTYILAIQLLSFGGFSGITQTGSVFSNTTVSASDTEHSNFVLSNSCSDKKTLSIYKYIIGKATLSLSLTFITIIYVFYFMN